MQCASSNVSSPFNLLTVLLIAIRQAVGGELSAERKAAWAAWAADWRRQLQAEGRSDEERQAAQNAVNPAYIPRNHVMQTAIAAAEKGNSSEVLLSRWLWCFNVTHAGRIIGWAAGLGVYRVRLICTPCSTTSQPV